MYDQIAKEIIAFRRDLHRYPELSLQEKQTAAKVAGRLRELGLLVRTGVGGHGVVAELRGASSGRTIALRADMDALPIQEMTDLPFASVNPGVMHACGHDAHTAILLGAAMLLCERKQALKGTIRFLFQAAEEVSAGAKGMIEQGVLEGVDEIYGLHNLPTLAAGKVAFRYGSMMGSADRIDIHIEGKGGHGAIPDRCIDPIVCASQIVISLQSIVSRELSPFDPVVVTIGSIHAGEANNVIPQHAALTGTVRTFNPEVRERIPKMIERIVSKLAEAFRCQAKLTYTRQVPVLVNHDSCVDACKQIVSSCISESRIEEAEPVMAAEDFSLYLERVKGCFFWLGSGPKKNAEQAHGLHHPQYTLNEDCIPLGASLLAKIAEVRGRHN